LFISLLFGDLSALGAVIIDNADMLNRLSYSRSLEKQSDEDAVVTLTNNRIDIDGMVELFETLESGNNPDVTEFISSHPLTKDRKRYAEEQASRQTNAAANEALEKAWQQIESSR
jgi:beta-barrel assembly-enhancing protease